MITLNQIIDEIKRFGRSHGQLNEVNFCAPHAWLDRPDVKYTALFFDYIRARKVKNQLVVDFSVWIADRILAEGTNEAEVWSDTLLIGCDILSYLSRDDAEYSLDDGVGFTPFTESTPDLLTGHKADITIRLQFPYDRCIIPTRPSVLGFLVTEDGKAITTEDGQKISVDSRTGKLVTETGQTITTEDGQTIIL